MFAYLVLWRTCLVFKIIPLKVHELTVNKESISFQTDMRLVDLWLSITRMYFKNNRFDVTDTKLVIKTNASNSEQIKGMAMKIMC